MSYKRDSEEMAANLIDHFAFLQDALDEFDPTSYDVNDDDK